MKTAVVIMAFLLGFSLFILSRAQGQGTGTGARTADDLPFHDDPQQALTDAKERACCIVLCIAARG